MTDMDRIEVSNLSRQFLKSVRGALVVQKWNPAVNIETLEAKVGAYSGDRFDDRVPLAVLECAGQRRGA